MRPPVQVWESRHDEGNLGDLTTVIRRYLATPGARTMTGHQTAQAERLTPLERALTPASR